MSFTQLIEILTKRKDVQKKGYYFFQFQKWDQFYFMIA